MLKFSKLLEQVATAYLRRRGLVVLERTFVGVIIAINSSTVECIQERDNDLCSRNRSQ